MGAKHSASNNHTDYIWLDGEVQPWESGNTHIMSHTLHYGSGCFEGIRCYESEDGPTIFRLRDHIVRLKESAALYKITLPYDVDTIVEGCIGLVKKNELRSAYIRPIVFYGFDTLGVHPNGCPLHVAVACFQWGAYLGEDGLNNGVKITVSPWRKFHHTAMPSTAKACGQYLNSMLAVQDAHARGFDEALLLNMEGNIAEGSGQNLFLVKDGELYTNDADSSILLGITRDTVIQIAQDQGIRVNIGTLTLDQMYAADEAFFTGTATEVTPIRQVDEHPIGSGTAGDLTKEFRTNYFDIVFGRNKSYSRWLDYVDELAVVRVAG
ncbi:branched-chain amino acid transaminase [Candidatus Neomarinimicrobiota bacterium]